MIFVLECCLKCFVGLFAYHNFLVCASYTSCKSNIVYSCSKVTNINSDNAICHLVSQDCLAYYSTQFVSYNNLCKAVFFVAVKTNVYYISCRVREHYQINLFFAFE